MRSAKIWLSGQGQKGDDFKCMTGIAPQAITVYSSVMHEILLKSFILNAVAKAKLLDAPILEKSGKRISGNFRILILDRASE